MLAPETILQGRYRIVGPLGQGGMGAVYEAIDQRLETVVALKETLFADERLRKQFEREARLLAGLHHPALPRVSDHFNEGEGEFLVMQFVAGHDLSVMQAQRGGPFPAADVLKWADQLLDALDYLHTQDPQIIHRDIKPQNLKLTARGQIVLLDFGLAKGSVGQMTAVTTSASIFGYTPNYAPLEQVQGLGTDSRSDLYSLAATIYHLATGVKPPDALSRAASLVNGQPDPLLPANEVALQVYPAVAAVLAKGMAQNREQRYGSAADMRTALSAAAAGATVPDREAATVLLAGAGAMGTTVGTAASEQPTALVGDRGTAMAPERHTVAAETVTRVSPSAGKNSALGKGLIAAALLLLCAGGFYGYRAIRNRSVTTDSSMTAQPGASSPNPNPTTESLVADPNVDGSRVEGAKPPAEAPVQRIIIMGKEAGKQNPPTASRKTNEAQPQEPPVTPAHPQTGTTMPDFNRLPFPHRPIVPNTNPERTERVPGGVRVRTLPDGTQIVTQPDGRSVVTRPNGQVRVFGPGEAPMRRPLRRRVP
jgi:serine/threonine protein kinase